MLTSPLPQLAFIALTQAPANPPPVRGRIQGGWEYIWASYLVTWVFFAVYVFSIWRRYVKSREAPPQ